MRPSTAKSSATTPPGGNTQQFAPRFPTQQAEEDARLEAARQYAHLLGLTAVAVGGPILSRVFRRFCEDYRYWGGGLPDLMLIRKTATNDILTDSMEHSPTNTAAYFAPDEYSVKFSEVKGPGDRLSEKQVWWLLELALAGADVEVCCVRAT
eukprot:Selendium_serpulae@DN5448_c0_g1_i2.p1